MGLLRGQTPADSFQAAGKMVRRSPWGVVLFIYGVMSLAGLPLTPGYSGRWIVMSVAAAQSPWLAGLLLLAAASSLFGLGRAVAAVLASAEGDDRPLTGRERLLIEGAAVVVLVGGVLLAVFPQLLFDLI